MAMVTIKGTEIDVRPLTPEIAAALRQICTGLGLPKRCPFRACRRAHRCQTRQVLCYHLLRVDINAIIKQRLAEGPPHEDRQPPVTPVTGSHVVRRPARC